MQALIYIYFFNSLKQMNVGIVDTANELEKKYRAQIQNIKTSHYPGNGNKNKGKVIFWIVFFFQYPNSRKISIHVILAAKFPTSYLNGTNALNKLFVLFTEES